MKNTTQNQAKKPNFAQAKYISNTQNLPKSPSRFIVPRMHNNEIAMKDGKIVMDVIDLRAFVEISEDGTQVYKNTPIMDTNFLVVSSTVLDKHFGENVSDYNCNDDIKAHLFHKDGTLKEFNSIDNIRALLRVVTPKGKDFDKLNKGYLKTIFGDKIQHESVLSSEAKEQVILSKDQQKTVEEYQKVKEYKKTEQKRKDTEKANAKMKELGY